MVATTLVWLRQDLRLEDNLALIEAAADSDFIVPVFIFAPAEEGDWSAGGASKVWLHLALEALSEELAKRGGRLLLASGDSASILARLAKETKASSLYFNRRYEPASRTRDDQVVQKMEAFGVRVKTFNSSLLFEPERVKTKEGQPYRVFTPFWRAALMAPEPDEPRKAPARINVPGVLPDFDKVEELHLLPKIRWDKGIKAAWNPGERGARQRLEHLLDSVLADYSVGRDRPDLDGVSRISPYLHWGDLSPRTVYHAVKDRVATARSSKLKENAAVYVKELGWREFAYHLLFHFPHTTDQPLHEQYKHFPWKGNGELLRLWQKGLTGYPIVDAGMRQLWTTGWMHNRVRMIVASFLVKDLLIPWQDGARWFWDTLVDADLASNTLGWQWTAGCGADAAPFFRIFNPVSQSVKFDPDGKYIRQWVPELGRVDTKVIHAPWQFPLELKRLGVTLGEDYPYPVVDHAIARKRALDALSSLKAVKSS